MPARGIKLTPKNPFAHGAHDRDAGREFARFSETHNQLEIADKCLFSALKHMRCFRSDLAKAGFAAAIQFYKECGPSERANGGMERAQKCLSALSIRSKIVSDARKRVEFAPISGLMEEVVREISAGRGAGISVREEITVHMLDKARTGRLNALGKEFGDVALAAYFEAVGDFARGDAKSGILLCRRLSENGGDEVILFSRKNCGLNRNAVEGAITSRIKAKLRLAGVPEGALDGFAGVHVDEHEFKLSLTRRGGKISAACLCMDGNAASLQSLIGDTESERRLAALERKGHEGHARVLRNTYRLVPEFKIRNAPPGKVYSADLTIRIGFRDNAPFVALARESGKGVAAASYNQCGPSIFNSCTHLATDALVSRYGGSIIRSLGRYPEFVEIEQTAPMSFGINFKSGYDERAKALLERAVMKANAGLVGYLTSNGLPASGVGYKIGNGRMANEIALEGDVFARYGDGLKIDAGLSAKNSVERSISLLLGGMADNEEAVAAFTKGAGDEGARKALLRIPAYAKDRLGMLHYLREDCGLELETINRIFSNMRGIGANPDTALFPKYYELIDGMRAAMADGNEGRHPHGGAPIGMPAAWERIESERPGIRA
jgi:hypothetical protein